MIEAGGTVYQLGKRELTRNNRAQGVCVEGFRDTESTEKPRYCSACPEGYQLLLS